ncbi:hypothetical protein HDU84_009511 [Entophlyctis sp. JEL0112]|nr:hypothetical protein HDU84_009511 [Entophlyctis sp. JEL0112]
MPATSQPPAPAHVPSQGSTRTLLAAKFDAIRTAQSDAGREALSNAICSLIAGYAREVQGEAFSKFMQTEVNKRIFELIHSQDISHKLAGLVIIGL